jgi:hypothetical protein
MIISLSEQGTDDWLEDRAGAITASMFETARSTLKDGVTPTAAARKYAWRLAVERVSGKAASWDKYQTFAMRRGNELETEARFLHEKRHNIFIEQGGFVATDDRRFGCSLDGWIGEEGMAEYKCFSDDEKVISIMLDDNQDGISMDQIQGCLWITNRQWCDYGLYFPDFECNGMDLIVHRIYRDNNYIDMLVDDLVEFDNTVQALVARINDKAAWLARQKELAIKAGIIQREFVSDGVKVVPEFDLNDLGDIF